MLADRLTLLADAERLSATAPALAASTAELLAALEKIHAETSDAARLRPMHKRLSKALKVLRAVRPDGIERAARNLRRALDHCWSAR
jgi:hypothetical protein